MATIAVSNPDLDHFAQLCGDNPQYIELLHAVQTKSTNDLRHLPPGHAAQAYLSCWGELSTTIHNNQHLVIYKTNRLVIPDELRPNMLKKLHTTGHCRNTRMKRLAQEIVFWPGITKAISAYVENCTPCRELQPNAPPEPLIIQTASYPIQQLGADLFQWNNKNFLAVADRFSGFLWCQQLRNTKTDNVTRALQDIFNDFGYPTAIQSDNGPQFRGPFKEFCEQLGIQHITSSPYHPESNGLAESAVKILKHLLSKSKKDKSCFASALAAWRNTPKSDAPSPAELMFGFRQRQPGLPYLRKPTFIARETHEQTRHQHRETAYTRRGGRALPNYKPGDPAFLKTEDGWTEEVTIKDVRPTGRSYTVTKDNGETAIRNRRELKHQNAPA